MNADGLSTPFADLRQILWYNAPNGSTDYTVSIPKKKNVYGAQRLLTQETSNIL